MGLTATGIEPETMSRDPERRDDIMAVIQHHLELSQKGQRLVARRWRAILRSNERISEARVLLAWPRLVIGPLAPATKLPTC